MEGLPTGVELNNNILTYNRLSPIEDKPSLDVLNFLNSILCKSHLFLVIFSKEKYGVIYSKNPKDFLKFRKIFDKKTLKLFFENHTDIISNITIAFFKEELLIDIKNLLNFDDKIYREYKIQMK